MDATAALALAPGPGATAATVAPAPITVPAAPPPAGDPALVCASCGRGGFADLDAFSEHVVTCFGPGFDDDAGAAVESPPASVSLPLGSEAAAASTAAAVAFARTFSGAADTTASATAAHADAAPPDAADVARQEALVSAYASGVAENEIDLDLLLKLTAHVASQVRGEKGD